MIMDGRVPVAFGALADASDGSALLYEGLTLPPGQLGVSFLPGPGVLAVGCACCAPRGLLAQALGDMFLARAKGDVAFFRRVVAVAATEEGRATMIAVLTEDPLCAARFKLV